MGDRVTKIVVVALLVVLGVYIAQPYVDRLLFSASTSRTVEPRGALADIERTSIDIFERASPSVVQVVGARPGALEASQSEGENGPAQSGTGFIWDAAGHIVTNDHVVEGTGSLAVRLATGQVLRAQLVGTAPKRPFLSKKRVSAMRSPPFANRFALTPSSSKCRPVSSPSGVPASLPAGLQPTSASFRAC